MASPTITGFYDNPPPGSGYGGWNSDGGYNPKRFRQAALQSLGQENAFGLQAERNAYDAYRDFDPSQSFKDYYGGVLDETGSALGDALDRLTGQSVGAGRLKTGFFDRDQGDTVRRFYSDAAARGQQGALQTAGMRQQQLAGLLDFGSQARNRYLDLLNGNFDRVTGVQNSKTGFGDVAGSILQTGAAVLPFLL